MGIYSYKFSKVNALRKRRGGVYFPSLSAGKVLVFICPAISEHCPFLIYTVLIFNMRCRCSWCPFHNPSGLGWLLPTVLLPEHF